MKAVLLRLIPWVLGALLLAAGLMKVSALGEFVSKTETLFSSKYLALLFGLLVPATEIVVGSRCVLVPNVRPAVFEAMMLLAIFTAVLVGQSLGLFPKPESCGCMPLVEFSERGAIVRNLTLLALGYAYLRFSQPTPPFESEIDNQSGR